MIEIQGHRGCRGIRPENTLPAFMTALDLGVEILELDVVISKDRKVVVSHEAYMNHEICLDMQGKEIPENKEHDFNLFQMDLVEIQKFDCGSKFHPRFPDQVKMKAKKPELREVFFLLDRYAGQAGLPLPRYNIEIKSLPEDDGKWNPKPEVFVELVIGEIHAFQLEDRVNLQSFDYRPLKLSREIAPDIPLSMLVEDALPMERHFERLGFIPEIFSPEFVTVSEDRVQTAHRLGVRMIPWTINEREDMVRMAQMGVDGLITDYPNVAMELRREGKI